MAAHAELAQQLDAVFWAENDRFLREIPYAAHLTDGGPLDPAYYLRHRIETIKRIRLTAYFDALSLAAMVREDYDAARIWARYVCEELDHDRMFYDDLAVHGLGRGEVDRTPCLPATDALAAFLTEKLERHGSIAAVAYSLFVEWNSARFSRPAVEKAGRAFGGAHVAGSLSHLEVDETEDHYEMMCDVAQRLCDRSGSSAPLFVLVREIASLFRQYFRELHEAAAGREQLVA